MAKIKNQIKKVLLVEDEQLLREICGKKLIMGGFDVVSVIDGVSAIKKAMEERPDLILLDIILPGIDGFEVLKRIRNHADPKVAKIPVIMLSNLGQDADVQRALRSGANGYLIKAQFTTDEIVAEVKKALKVK